MEHETAPGAADAAPDPAAYPAPGPAIEPTGEPSVDAAVRSLGELDGLPVAEHPQVFERIHGRLVDVLGELHADPAGPAGEAS